MKPILELEFPNVQFIDPAESVADKILKKTKSKQSKRNLLKIFSSDETKIFQNNLNSIGIKNKIKFLST